MRLFDINESIRNFVPEIDEETGEILNLDELDDLVLARDEKLEAIGCLIKEYRADGDALLNESRKLKDRSDRSYKKADNLERYLDNELNGSTFRTSKVDISYRRSTSVDIINEMMIPDRYCIYKTDRRPDKTLLKKALKSGEIIEGAVLKEKNNIHIG